MSKAKKATRTAGRVPGPIAAWRLSLAVGSAAVTTGLHLIDATRTGQHLDLALGRSFGVACVVWIAAGRVNRVFVDVEQKSRLAAEHGGAANRADDVDRSSSEIDGVNQNARS